MGCDVHLHTEIKLKGNWEHYALHYVPRNYQLFGKMAGVRHTTEQPIAAPRGIPGDATAVTRFDCDYWGTDGHTHSWLNAKEIVTLEDWLQEILNAERGRFSWPSDYFGYLFGNSWAGFTKYPDDRPEGLEDVRFIFWFDN